MCGYIPIRIYIIYNYTKINILLNEIKMVIFRIFYFFKLSIQNKALLYGEYISSFKNQKYSKLIEI